MSQMSQSKVGLLTDLHYDGTPHALDQLHEAIGILNRGGVDALVVMGDLINSTSALNARRLLHEVSALCDSFRGPVHYMPGNHDLDHLSKPDFYTELGRAGSPSRFCFELGGYEFICIDGNFSPDGTEYQCGNFQWQEAFVPAEQLDWIRARCAASLLPVVLISHQRIDKECVHAVRNHAEVCAIISASGKVKAVCQGHNHQDDLVQLETTDCYTLSAHKEGSGPAMLQLDPSGVLLFRNFRPLDAKSMQEE